MIRNFLSFWAPPPMAESLSTEALQLAEHLDLELFAAQLRSTLAVVAQFRGESSDALATWRRVSGVLDDQEIYAEDNACFYSLAEGEHGELL